MKNPKVGQRVTLPSHDFLSNGVIKENIPSMRATIVKLDEKAPNEYAWNTDEVFMWWVDIEEEA